MNKNKTKSIRIALSLFLLFYGFAYLLANSYFSASRMDFWLLPMGLNLLCLSFLFWPAKQHREKMHVPLFIGVIGFIYLSAILILLTALYLAASNIDVLFGFYITSPLILLAALLYFVGRKIMRQENLRLFI